MAFLLSNSVFLIARAATIILSALFFGFGLGQIESSFNFAEGNFNIPAIRFPALAAFLLFQLYMIYVFLKYQYKRARENEPVVASKAKVVKQKPKKKEGKEYY